MTASLKALALAATPGPWHVGVGGNFHANRVWTEAMRPVVNLCSFGMSPADIDPTAQANAAYIAAFSPDVALRLLAVVEAAQALIDKRGDLPQFYALRDALAALDGLRLGSEG